jgi:hypothetical protein
MLFKLIYHSRQDPQSKNDLLGFNHPGIGQLLQAV